MDKNPNYDVFISYASKDREWAQEFTSALEEAGVTAWFDSHQIQPGERWQQVLGDALRQSRILILILSSDSGKRPWMFFELGAAVADRKRIVPVLTEDVDVSELPPLVRQYQFVKESTPRDAGKRVAEAVTHLSESAA